MNNESSIPVPSSNYQVRSVGRSNNVFVKPKELLRGINIDVFFLLNSSRLKDSYDLFIKHLIRELNKNVSDDNIKAANKNKLNELNTVVYPEKDLTIVFVTDIHNEDEWITIQLHSNNGFTAGQILYELSKKLPGVGLDYYSDEVRDIYGDHTYFQGLRLSRNGKEYDLYLSS